MTSIKLRNTYTPRETILKFECFFIFKQLARDGWPGVKSIFWVFF